jgi:hypothetical protein
VKNSLTVAAYGDLYDRLKQCWPNCTEAQVNRIIKGVEKDHGITLHWTMIAHKNPIKEPTPSVDSSISGNDSSGQADDALTEAAPSDPLEDWATNGGTLEVGVDEVPRRRHGSKPPTPGPKPDPTYPWLETCTTLLGPGCPEPESNSTGETGSNSTGETKSNSTWEEAYDYVRHKVPLIIINTGLEKVFRSPCVIGTCDFRYGFWQMEPERVELPDGRGGWIKVEPYKKNEPRESEVYDPSMYGAGTP